MASKDTLLLTYHYINDDWMMRSGVLATRHMPEMHTGLNIGTRIDEVRKEFELDREFHIIVDIFSKIEDWF